MAHAENRHFSKRAPIKCFVWIDLKRNPFLSWNKAIKLCIENISKRREFSKWEIKITDKESVFFVRSGCFWIANIQICTKNVYLLKNAKWKAYSSRGVPCLFLQWVMLIHSPHSKVVKPFNITIDLGETTMRNGRFFNFSRQILLKFLAIGCRVKLP